MCGFWCGIGGLAELLREMESRCNCFGLPGCIGCCSVGRRCLGETFDGAIEHSMRQNGH